MAITIDEQFDSREATQSIDSPSIDLKYQVKGTEDDVAVRGVVEATIPAFYLSLPFQSYHIKPLGGGVWEVGARYGKQEQKDTGSSSFSFDTGGGPEYDAAWLWVNPSIADEGSPDATETPIDGPVSSAGYRHVNLDDTDIVHLRDIVVSTDFASAVPEPFSAMLLGLGGLALLRRRR